MSEEGSAQKLIVPPTTTSSVDCEDEESCPVCLLDDVVFVRSPCRHKVCLPCIERILSSPVGRHHGLEATVIPDDDAHLDVPTMGRCPVCRHTICLFDLVTVTPNKDTEPALAITKNHDIVSTDLKGRVYVQDGLQVGNQSLHFPSDDDTTAQGNHVTLPYIDFSNVDNMKFTNGSALPPKMVFEPDCHFHEPTRTFHGRIRWGDNYEDRVAGSLEWDYALTFSYDYQFVSRGVLTKKRLKCHRPNCPRLACKFPLDGQWSSLWLGSSAGGESVRRTLNVHNNICITMQDAWQIHYDDNKYPVVDPSSSRFISKHNLAEKDVKVGESIEFSMLSPDSDSARQWIWTRISDTSEHEHLEVLHFGSRQSQHYYYLQSTDCSNNRLPEYHEGNVWGNTFCQGFTVGLASYHFLEDIERGAYISYEHEMTSMWPPLDNGNPIPDKIWFTETSFEPETRTFYGKIDWEGKFGTTWQGSRWWRYKIEFDNHYSCIVGGYVMSVMSGLDDEREMSRFGVELLYINAGLVVQCHESGNFELLERTIQDLERRVWENVNSGGGSFLSELLFACHAAKRGNGRIRYPRSFGL